MRKHHEIFTSLRTTCQKLLIIAFFGWLFFFTSLPSHQNVANAQPSAPAVDNSTQVVDDWPLDFTIVNNKIYWTSCSGDLLNYDTTFESQLINVPASKQTLLTVNATACKDFSLLQADPVFLFYKNGADKKIERRHFLDFNNPNTILNFTSLSEPNAMVLADGYLYWADKGSRIRRISKMLDTGIQLVRDTLAEGVPVDLVVDDAYIWYGTSSGVYRMDRGCALPCTVVKQYISNIKKIYALSTVNPTRSSIFWITNDTPNTVESWDCNIPGQSGCFHKVLYTASAGFVIDGLTASPENVFWVEMDNANGFYFMKRVPRAGGASVKIVDPLSPRNGWLPARLIPSDADIYFRHNGISRIDQNAAPLVWNFVFDAMEVTQGVQNLLNDIKLIKGRSTYVRVYARQTLGDDISAPEALLEGTYNSVPLPGSPLQPVQRPKKFVTGQTWDRNDIWSSWLFELPPSWVVNGSVTLTARIDPRKLYDATPPSSGATTFSLYYRPPVCLVALKVSQHGPTADSSHPGWALAVRTARNMLPVGDVWIYRQGTRLEEGIWPYYSPYEMPGDSWKLLANIGLRQHISDDPDECQVAGARTIYVGLIHPHTSTGGANGAGMINMDELWNKLPETISAWGLNLAGWPINGREATLAHEIGHNFDRLHVNCPPGGPDDTGSYKYADPCVYSIEDGNATYYGFEPVAREPVGPSDASDLMSYNLLRWTSDFTYNGIFNNNIGVPLAPVLLPQASNIMVYLNGKIGASNPVTGTLNYAWALNAGALSPGVLQKWIQPASALQPAAPARYHAKFYNYLGRDRVLLADLDILPSRDTTQTGGSHAYYFELSAALPVLPWEIELLMEQSIIGDKVLDVLKPGRAMPQVEVTKPVLGEVVNQQLVVHWSAKDPNQDLLKFIIQYSPDDGAHWQTLASNILGDPAVLNYQAVFDSSLLPGSNGNHALVRVLASDGINTGLAVSALFQVPNRLPIPMITAPGDGAWFEAGEEILLEGLGTDPEDGNLDGALLSWYLNNVYKGTGRSLRLAGLAPGQYSLKLYAKDSLNATGVSTASFTVAPLKIELGSARLDGYCKDADYSQGRFVTLKPYADGSQASVFFVRSADYLWVCFSGLKKQGPSSPGAFAGIRLDANYSRDTWAQPSDYAFFVRQDGSQFTYGGNGSGGYSEPTPLIVDNSLASRVRFNSDGLTWNAEMRIQVGYTAFGQHVGVNVAHYWVDAQGNDFNWPFDAVYNKPNTWAENYTNLTPFLEAVSPEVATLPFNSVKLQLTGANFQQGDTVVWNGQTFSSTFIDASHIEVSIPGAGNPAGEYSLVVQSKLSSEIKSNPLVVTFFNPTPVLTSLSPQKVLAGSGVVIDLWGSGFVSGAVAYFNNRSIATGFLNSNHLTLTLTGADTALAGDTKIVIANPSPTAGVSNALSFSTLKFGIFLPLAQK